MQAACAPAVGSPFLTGTIQYFDCSARRIGAYGFSELGGAGGPGSSLVVAGLTVAIAYFGLRLMFGERLSVRAPVSLFARIAIVLVLAFSWPAVRTLFFDVAFGAPAQIAAGLTGAPSGADGVATLAQLQATDSSIQALTAWGTGREELNAVRTVSGQPAAQAFSSVAVSDRLAMGTARVLYLSSAILMTGGLRLVGGILFALLPLLAVFYLFRPSEGIVMGWMRAMLAVTLANAAGVVLLTLETSLALPWLSQRIAERAQTIATPNAPTELLVIVVLTATMAVLSTIVLTRVCFAHFPLFSDVRSETRVPRSVLERTMQVTPHSSVSVPSRELAISGAVARLALRDSRLIEQRTIPQSESTVPSMPSAQRVGSPGSNRHQLRQSRAARMRSGMQ